MAGKEQLKDVEFAENPEPRCACALLLDTSGSMSGAPIDALNQGLIVFKQQLAKDPQASKRVEIAVISFADDVTDIQDFVTVDAFDPPTLSAGGGTSMGAGIIRALDMIEARKQLYKKNGVTYYRPWVFMITDGEPTDSIETASQRIGDAETKKKVAFFPVGVEGANMGVLKQVSVRSPVKLKGLDFSAMFVWLSQSMGGVSRSRTDEMVALPPAGWASV